MTKKAHDSDTLNKAAIDHQKTETALPEKDTFPGSQNDTQSHNVDSQPAGAAKPQSTFMIALRSFLSFAGFVVAVVVLAVLINMYLFQSYYVDGTSMTPTLQSNDRLIIDKIPKTIADITGKPLIPKRGSIMVFNSPLIGADGKPEQLIKRIIGLPGERVVVSNGVITIYNKQNPKGFNVDKALGLHLAPSYGDVDEVVPKNQFFVCGDNRGPDGSYDSRVGLGTIPSNQLVGQLLVRVLPLNKAKLF